MDAKGYNIIRPFFKWAYNKPFRADQNDVIKNFAVIMNAVVKKVDCTSEIYL